MKLHPTDHDTAIDKIQIAQAELDSDYGKGFAESHQHIWATLANAYINTDLINALRQSMIAAASQH